MRKKSHLLLADCIIDNSGQSALKVYSKSFRYGNILPDLKPAFISTPHEFEATFPTVRDKIILTASSSLFFTACPRHYMRMLGEISHYIADYFTFPHNPEIFQGTLKEHCAYESRLKDVLKTAMIRRDESFLRKSSTFTYEYPDDIILYIEETHAEYLETRSSMEDDVLYITTVTPAVTESVLNALFAVMCGELEPIVQPAL